MVLLVLPRLLESYIYIHIYIYMYNYITSTAQTRSQKPGCRHRTLVVVPAINIQVLYKLFPLQLEAKAILVGPHICIYR